jgi:hypothetical protein
MKRTRYFEMMRNRPDRVWIKMEWIERAIMEGRYLRVILLPDGATVHNAFFDRSFMQ